MAKSRGKPLSQVTNVLKKAADASFARFQSASRGIQQYLKSGKKKKSRRFEKSTKLAAARKRKKDAVDENRIRADIDRAARAGEKRLDKGTRVPPVKHDGVEGGSNAVDNVSPEKPRLPIAAPSPGVKQLDAPQNVGYSDSMAAMNRG